MGPPWRNLFGGFVEAWKRDIPQADIRFYDTGHFALETHSSEIVPVIRAFLDKNVK